MIAHAALAGLVALAAAVPDTARATQATSSDRLAVLLDELGSARGSPRGMAVLAEIGSLAEEAPDLASLASAYERSAESRRSHAEVRALARFRLAELERRRGNLRRSAAHLGHLGFVTSWKVIGPFDDEGKIGFALAYPPETSLDFSARMPGKVREVAWRELPPEAVENGFVHLGGALRPLREVVAYAVAAVEARHDERVQLWLGASGAAKVFVNGVLAIADPGYHVARLDQRGATVSLRKGTNRILVKLCHESGRMGFYLRLANVRGAGIRVVPGDSAAPLPQAGSAPAPIRDAIAVLQRQARRSRGLADVRAQMDLALVLDERQSTDNAERLAAAAARRAVEIAPRSVETRLLAARLEDEHGRRRAHLDAALAAAPEDPRVLLALAQDELEQDRPHAALRLLDRAGTVAPQAAVRIARADALERMELAARAALTSAQVARDFPTVPGAIRAAVRAARRLGRQEEAIGRLRTLLALRFDDGEARGSLSRLLAERGDVAAAASLIAEGIRLAPSDVSERLRLAQLLASNGRQAEAETEFEAAIRLAPEDPDAWERRGRARLLAGRQAEAKSDLERALDLRPQSPDLKELVRSLEPARERFEKPYLLDARALAAASGAAPEDEDAVVLGELKVTRVFPSGLSATYEQLVVKVLTQRGADQYRRRMVSWAPERQEVRVERARVLKPSGAADETHDESERSGSEPWYRLYYDTRVKTLSFPSLAPGDVLEVAWRVEDVAGENLLSDYFGDFTMVDGGTSKLRFEYVLLAPETRPIHANAPPGVVRSDRKLPGGVVERRFSAHDLQRVVFEPNMPGWSEVGRYVHVSTYEGWDEVGRFYWNLVKDQVRPTEEVRRTAVRVAQEALAGRSRNVTERPRNGGSSGPETRPAASPAAGLDAAARKTVVGAVYDFVVSQTRYVGLEFGIHGYKPYRVDDVLRRRFGDCKDKASLMHALLESLGIDSRLVLLRMRRLGTIPEAPASLAVFNHAILYVPELDLWLDGTAAYSGSRELPDEDRGASVLVVNPGSPSRFGTIPDATAGANRTDAVFDVVVGSDGSATVRGESRIAGAQAPRYRSSYLSEHDRRAQLEKAFNRTFPGLHVKALSLSDLTRIEDDVELSFELEVPRYARKDGSGLRFTPFGAGAGYVESYAAQSERRHDLVLGGPNESRFTYRFVFPAGWAAVEVPEDASTDTPDGAFEVHYRIDGSALLVEGRVTLKTSRVPAARYSAFREFAAGVDRAFARRVWIAPVSAERADAPGPSSVASAGEDGNGAEEGGGNRMTAEGVQ